MKYDNIFLLVGNWSFSEGPKGLSVFRYNGEDVSLTPTGTFFETIKVGAVAVHPNSGAIYLTEDTEHLHGQIGGGGYLLQVRLAPNGDSANMTDWKTYSSNPSHICLSRDRHYLLVCHHCKFGHVTRLIRNQDGTFSSTTIYDDAGLDLFSLAENGDIQYLQDVYITPGFPDDEGHAISHQHSVACDPSGKLFALCDKGTDRVYLFHIQGHQLSCAGMIETASGFAPRDCIFHPRLPLLYVNGERSGQLLTFRYFADSGTLELVAQASMVEPTVVVPKPMPSALLLSENGETLYCAIRAQNTIVVLHTGNSGLPQRIQTIPCGGDGPRGLCLSPDGTVLFSANSESGTITAFLVLKDGKLSFLGERARSACPSDMIFWTANTETT